MVRSLAATARLVPFCPMKFKRLIFLATVTFAAIFGIALSFRTRPITPWSSPGSHVHRVVFSPMDDRFAVISSPLDTEERIRHLTVVERETGRTLLAASEKFISDLCFDQRANYLAAFMFHDLVVYDLRTGEKCFSTPRTGLLSTSNIALAFTTDEACLVASRIGQLEGAQASDSERITFSIPSGQIISSTIEPTFWYGENVATDGTKWFSGGWPGPTPRVFTRNNEYMGYCYRNPNIVGAFFTRDSNILLSIHPDAAVMRWDLTHVDQSKAVKGTHIGTVPELLKCQTITMLNTENGIAAVDTDGHFFKYAIPN